MCDAILYWQSLSNSHEHTKTPITHHDVRKAKITFPVSNSLTGSHGNTKFGMWVVVCQTFSEKLVLV